MTDSKLWNELSFMLLGIALFEFTSRVIAWFETHHEYYSLRYMICYVLTTLGLCIAISYVLRIYIKTIKTYPNLAPNPLENADLSLFRDIFELLKTIIKNVKQSLRHFTNYNH